VSEYIDNDSQRKEKLKSVILQLHEGKTVDDVKNEFAELLRDVGATEVAQIEQTLIAEGLPAEEVKQLCDVHVAVFRDSLDVQTKPETIAGHPIHTFRAENAAAAQVLEHLKVSIAALKSKPGAKKLEQTRERLQEIRELEKHYLRKENLLFPYLENHGFSGPSSVMWAIHDDIRAGWKELYDLLESGIGKDKDGFLTRLAEVFEPLDTAIREMFYKEENILFSTALDMLSEDEWLAIRRQEAEVGYCYVEPGNDWPPQDALRAAGEPVPEPQTVEAGQLRFDTGALSVNEVSLMFSHLPVDVTLVGADDRVRFYSEGGGGLFPRSPAVIGRLVQQCHPPASVHRVQQILDGFRDGSRDVAEFWIQMKGRFIHIRYFAFRDAEGTYLGTLEVTQDVTGIRSLEGEKRLLDD
jgi:DUF438 domain-containing protein